MFEEIEHPGVGEYLAPRSPLDFGSYGRLPVRRAPRSASTPRRSSPTCWASATREIGDLEERGVVGLASWGTEPVQDVGLVGTDLTADALAVLDALPDAVTVQDRDGALVYVNQAACRLVGYETPDKMLSAGAGAAFAAWTTTHEDGRPLSADELPGRRVLMGLEAEPVVLRAVHNETGSLRWTRTQAVALRDEQGALRFVVNLIEDITQTKLAELRQRVLAQAGEMLSGTPDVERTLAQVAGLAVPEIAEWCAFEVEDGRGGTRLVALAHSDPAKIALARELRERFPPEIRADRGIGRVLTGQAEHYPVIPDALLKESASSDEHLALLRELGMRSAISVPVSSGTEVLGALTLVDGTRPLTEDDCELAEELGRRAGDALTTARLFEERTDVAQILQSALLPSALPSIPGWDLATLFAPAAGTTVGGDFYDLFFVPDGWWLVIGDVAGRGTPAAALTSIIRYTVRTAATLTDDLATAAQLVDETLRERGELFCTLAVMRVSGSEPTQVLCAGHPSPALVVGDHVEWIGSSGPILGAVEDAVWRPAAVDVPVDGAVVLYTDGILDARGSEGMFGEDRLAAVLADSRGKDAAAVITAIEQAIAAHVDEPGRDDIAAVCARRLG